jgi:hypothetical protein
VIDTIFAEKSVPSAVGFGKPHNMTAAGFYRGKTDIVGEALAVVIPEFENIVEIGGFEADEVFVRYFDDAHNSFPYYYLLMTV